MNEDEVSKGILAKAHPIAHFLLGLSLAAVGVFISSVISLMILYAQSSSLEEVLHGAGNAGIGALVSMQLISQLIVFILPALLFSYLVNKNIFNYFLSEDKSNPWKYLLGIIIVFSTALFIQVMVIDKANFEFPSYLKFFEDLAKSTQREYDGFIAKILMVTNPLMLVLVFVMVAVMPAIGEELLFRGLIQRSLEQGLKNKWLAIFISGTLFGIIHFEFYNFFALCFMGYILGFIYSLTKNIYITMLLHFINNGTAIITMYMYKKNMIAMNPDESAPIYVVVSAGIVMCAALYVLWKYSKNNRLDLKSIHSTQVDIIKDE